MSFRRSTAQKKNSAVLKCAYWHLRSVHMARWKYNINIEKHTDRERPLDRIMDYYLFCLENCSWGGFAYIYSTLNVHHYFLQHHQIYWNPPGSWKSSCSRPSYKSTTSLRTWSGGNEPPALSLDSVLWFNCRCPVTISCKDGHTHHTQCFYM